MSKKLPSFLIIGMAKCGTTSLAHALKDHSKIVMANHKELYFFNNIQNYKRGKNYYVTLFPDCKPDQICFEATPHYLRYEKVPERVKELIPKAKFIVLLRNPVKRATSQAYGYLRQCKRKGEKPVFTDVNDIIESLFKEEKVFANHHSHYILKNYARNILTWGKYYSKYLENWFKVFPRHKFLIIKAEDFFNNEEKVVKKCFKFLNLKPEKVAVKHILKGRQQNIKQLGRNEYKQPSKQLQHQLKEYFRPYNQKLYNLLGRDFNWEKEI